MPTTSDLVIHVERCLADVREGRVHLPYTMHAVGGMCGWEARKLVNALCRDGGPVKRYLEVEVLHGAMLCAAAYGNSIDAIGIDDFSQFGGSLRHAQAMRTQFREGTSNCVFWERDMFDVDTRSWVPQIDLFVYDALHSYAATRRAIAHFAPGFAAPCLLLVDDWLLWQESEETQRGVADGLKDAGLHVAHEWVLESRHEGDAETYWNGMWLAVVTR